MCNQRSLWFRYPFEYFSSNILHLGIIQFGRDWQNPVYDDKEMQVKFNISLSLSQKSSLSTGSTVYIDLYPYLQLVTAVVSWCGIAIHQHQVSGMLKKQRELNDFLMEISQCVSH